MVQPSAQSLLRGFATFHHILSTLASPWPLVHLDLLGFLRITFIFILKAFHQGGVDIGCIRTAVWIHLHTCTSVHRFLDRGGEKLERGDGAIGGHLDYPMGTDIKVWVVLFCLVNSFQDCSKAPMNRTSFKPLCRLKPSIFKNPLAQGLTVEKILRTASLHLGPRMPLSATSFFQVFFLSDRKYIFFHPTQSLKIAD